MSMDLTTFISNFQGGARNNRFVVTIFWPSVVGSPNVSDQIVCQATSLPASTMGVVNVPYMGRTIPVPGDRTYEPWTVTITNDITFSHRNTLERWNNLILAHQLNVQGTQSYKDITATIQIEQKDRNDNVLKTVRLLNAFPSQVSEITLDYSTNDQVETFTSTFNFSHMESPDSPLT